MKPLALAAVALLAACGGPNAPSDTCTMPTSCPHGVDSYRFCSGTTGMTSATGPTGPTSTTCKYVASDGVSYECASCADCGSAIAAIGNWCASGSASPSGLPDFAGGQTYGVDLDAPALVEADLQPGYAITASAGGHYRVVWVGAKSTGVGSKFSGTVWTTDVFASVTPGCADGSCRLEAGDFVSQPEAATGGQLISFDAMGYDLAGFEFTIADQPIYFDLLVDGQRHPELVFITDGGAAASPATDPFAITTN